MAIPEVKCTAQWMTPSRTEGREERLSGLEDTIEVTHTEQWKEKIRFKNQQSLMEP
jgi:hypothetical protein